LRVWAMGSWEERRFCPEDMIPRPRQRDASVHAITNMAKTASSEHTRGDAMAKLERGASIFSRMVELAASVVFLLD
jgi:hypothetical protein